MKKLLFLLIIGLVLALFLGCDDFMPPDVHDSPPYSTDSERKDVLALKHLQIPNVSEDTLASYVMDFIRISAASETGTGRSVQPAPAVVITKTTEIIHPVETGFAETTADKRSARSVIGPGRIPFYVFTLENQQTGKTGFALTCGDNRIGNVLAVAEEGNYDDENPFLGIFYSQLNAYIEETIGIYNSITETDIENALGKINKARYTGPSVPDVPVTEVGMHGDFELVGYKNDGANNNDNCILKTIWHQRDPYNDIVKKKKGYDCVTGCGPVAIAQVMAFHSKPSNPSESMGYNIEYNWSDMIDGTKDEQVGILMYEIGRHAGSIYMKAGTATTRGGVKKALIAMGYEDPGSFKGYNFEKVKSSINDGCPVIADGSRTGINILGITISTPEGGHYWVIDGYRRMSVNAKFDKSKAPELYTTNYVHCNLGWGGSNNGWYYSGVFDTENIPYSDDSDNLRSVGTDDKFYQYGLGILTDIRHKQEG